MHYFGWQAERGKAVLKCPSFACTPGQVLSERRVIRPKENRIQLPRIGPRGRDLIVALQRDANDSVLYHSLSELEMGEAQKGNPQQKIGALYEQRVYRS